MNVKSLIAFTLFMIEMPLAHAQTSSYNAFPSNFLWRVDYYFNNPFQYPCSAKSYFQYSLGGDTLINSIEYKKIYRSASVVTIPNCTKPMVPPGPPYSGYAGALREDTLNNRATYVFPNSIEDELLYDYNLTVGDTLQGFIVNNFTVNPLTVSEIDSVLINGNYHTKWIFTSTPESNAPYIIEGIGSHCGLIEPLFTYYDDFMRRYLVCVLDSTDAIFTTNYISDYGCTPITIDIQNILTPTQYSLAPNPFSDQTLIQLDKPLDNATLVICNYLGAPIKRIENLHGTSLILQRNALPSGMYFFQIQQENKTIASDNFIIID